MARAAVPVAITADGPADFEIPGRLCYRGPFVPQTVQLLVHGATYNGHYWNFTSGDGYYSYVVAATLSGYPFVASHQEHGGHREACEQAEPQAADACATPISV
jgi:hypothetical protein